MIVEKIRTVLENTLPANSYICVQPFTTLGDKYIKIVFAASDKDYLVRGQKPCAVSLALELDTMRLYPQAYACMGGQTVFTKKQMLRIPFRKPKPEEKNVLNAIEKFAQNWVKILTENIDILEGHGFVDFKEYLKK